MSEPLVVTDEMRRAVFREQCSLEGHQLSLANVLSNTDPDGKQRTNIKGPAGQEPHLFCSRCSLTWIVVDSPGYSYNAALRKFRDRLIDTDPMKQTK